MSAAAAGVPQEGGGPGAGVEGGEADVGVDGGGGERVNAGGRQV